MKRRDLLMYAAAGSGYILTRRAGAVAPCPPPSVAVAGGTAATTVCAATAASALADWTTRSTAPGVTQAIRFNNVANVTKWTHPDASTALVIQNPTDGIIGDGCLQINQPATLSNGGQWRIPLNAAWTTDGSGFGTGVDYYVQYRCKLGPNRLTPAFGDQPGGRSGGFKVNILGGYQFSSPQSSSSDIDCEIVCTNPAWIGLPVVYNHGIGQDVQTFQRTIAGYTSQQDAIDHGPSVTNVFNRYCLYEGESSPTSPGCWFFQEQQWFTVYIHVKIAVFTASPGTGNVLQVYVARQGETSYTQLFQENDFQQAADPSAPNGNQAIWLLPYDSHRSNASYSTYQAYDQVIVSTNPIACPLF